MTFKSQCGTKIFNLVMATSLLDLNTDPCFKHGSFYSVYSLCFVLLYKTFTFIIS